MGDWSDLPADAPEPAFLSIVSDKFGMHWCRIAEATYHERWAGVSGENAGDLTSWDSIQRPLSLHVPDGVLLPLTASTEPSPYEVRRDALRSATAALLPNPALAATTDVSDDDVAEVHARMYLTAARVFEGYLRVDETRAS